MNTSKSDEKNFARLMEMTREGTTTEEEATRALEENGWDATRALRALQLNDMQSPKSVQNIMPTKPHRDMRDTGRRGMKEEAEDEEVNSKPTNPSHGMLEKMKDGLIDKADDNTRGEDYASTASIASRGYTEKGGKNTCFVVSAVYECNTTSHHSLIPVKAAPFTEPASSLAMSFLKQGSSTAKPAATSRAVRPKPRHEIYPGAEAVAGPNASMYRNRGDDLMSQSDEGEVSSQVIVAAEIAPDDIDIEAELDARLRKETDNIAAQVEERIMRQAVQANVVDSDSDEHGFTFTRRKKWWIAGGVVLAAIIGIAVALIVVFVPKDDTSQPTDNPIFPPPSEPSTNSTAEPSSRLSSLHERLSPIFGDLLSDESTPQFAALQWLSDTDPANLPVENTPLATLQKRFILATLYFATNGASWTQQYNFLTEGDICSWNDGGLQGVRCDETDYIHIELGKCIVI